ncbi:hypothetical protein ACWDR2_34990 [Streptomyces sp. NPDC003631]|jgi:hypothetical protein|uniref:Secreted protein n=1 Tax=Streptomyces lannensis TaxID=766498 RepID=A0ABP7KZI3_9ACTN|nr:MULTISPECIES: hypothetical protein [unclassified Streptomyces]MBW8705976.1 hypothetical protein [Streptomyces sp. MBT84]MDX3265264.1 hypothetical protein [Streptomyces sp. MI02-2A]MEE1670731.1 hypothetical protein [Streptomyces sp. WAC07094]REE58558.1 hypothetical protein BX257_0984 [Streptomyces sp. 3212.3]
MAKRVLIAEALLVAGLATAVLLREMPGLVREVRIWRMVGLPGVTRRRR